MKPREQIRAAAEAIAEAQLLDVAEVERIVMAAVYGDPVWIVDGSGEPRVVSGIERYGITAEGDDMAARLASIEAQL